MNNYFIISKKNLLYNINYIKNKLTNNTKFCAMVKADGYGHNAKIISKLIEKEVDYFGVANINEAIFLRRSGIKKPIMIVAPLSLKDCVKASKYNIEFSITNVEQIYQLLNLNIKFKVHLKINTGFNRLGIDNLDEFYKIQDLIINSTNIKCIGVFTHFASADSDYKFLLQQIKRFEIFKKSTYLRDCLFHCGNTHCALNYSNINYDMVRVGLGIYGYGDSNLKPVLTIRSKIIQIHNIKVGDRVGYNNGFIANEECKMGVVSLGYADGINRKLCNFKLGNNVSIIGNICMDMFMVKINNDVKVGSIIDIFNNADIWAKQCGTISYEILTSLSYKRMKYIIK